MQALKLLIDMKEKYGEFDTQQTFFMLNTLLDRFYVWQGRSRETKERRLVYTQNFIYQV